MSVDFSGPFEPDIDGNTHALVGVEVVTSKGFVGLQQTRSAADTLESLRDFEADLKSCAADSSVGIAEFTNPIPRTQLRCHDHGVTLVKETSRGLARNLVRLKPDISFRDHRLILSGPTKLSFVSGNILLWFPQ